MKLLPSFRRRISAKRLSKGTTEAEPFCRKQRDEAERTLNHPFGDGTLCGVHRSHICFHALFGARVVSQSRDYQRRCRGSE